MENSPFRSNLVLNTDDLVVVIDENGVAGTGTKYKLGITATCKELQQQAKMTPKTDTTTLRLKPTCSNTKRSNAHLAAPFGLAAWLNKIKTLHFVNPERVTLDLGIINTTTLMDYTDWQLNIEHLANRIPLEGITRTDIVFAVMIGICAGPTKIHDITVPLPDELTMWMPPLLAKATAPGISSLKRSITLLSAQELQVADQRAVAERKIEMWNSLHMAEYALSHILLKVYTGRDRVQSGQPRHPAHGEFNSYHWIWHD